MADDLTAEASGTDAALALFGVAPVSVEDIPQGTVNRHWLVRTELGQLVLRRYWSVRSGESISFEHALLGHAMGKGWPVAAPLRTTDGRTVVEEGGRRWSLFPLLPGRPEPYESLAMKHVKGRLLGRFHDDMADFPVARQRPDSGRVWELDVFVRVAGHDSFNQLLRRFAEEYPEIATGVRREKYRNLRELARLGYGETPAVVVHRDFHHDNLLFQDGELTGLLDFDLACWDAAAADVASSLALECLEAPSYDGVDMAMARAFLMGYTEQRRMTLEEARMVPALVRASFLWLVMFRLVQWADTRSERAVESVRRSVERRFPRLAGQWAELVATCEGVAV